MALRAGTAWQGIELCAGVGMLGEAACAKLPLFAPGPRDVAGWQQVVDAGAFDWLRPAIEPGLCVLADGLALVVDAARPDQLRCAGNGVVPLQAAACFVELLRRVIEG